MNSPILAFWESLYTQTGLRVGSMDRENNRHAMGVDNFPIQCEGTRWRSGSILMRLWKGRALARNGAAPSRAHFWKRWDWSTWSFGRVRTYKSVTSQLQRQSRAGSVSCVPVAPDS